MKENIDNDFKPIHNLHLILKQAFENIEKIEFDKNKLKIICKLVDYYFYYYPDNGWKYDGWEIHLK